MLTTELMLISYLWKDPTGQVVSDEASTLIFHIKIKPQPKISNNKITHKNETRI